MNLLINTPCSVYCYHGSTMHKHHYGFVLITKECEHNAYLLFVFFSEGRNIDKLSHHAVSGISAPCGPHLRRVAVYRVIVVVNENVPPNRRVPISTYPIHEFQRLIYWRRFFGMVMKFIVCFHECTLPGTSHGVTFVRAIPSPSRGVGV